MLGVGTTIMFRNFDIKKRLFLEGVKQCFKIKGKMSHIFVLFS